MTIKVQWVKELPGRPPAPRRGFYKPREGSQDLVEHAAALVKHPYRWALYPRELSPRQAHSVTNALQEGLIAAYSPQLGFEAVRRGDKVYVRHNPQSASPTTLAFYAGYRKGVRETIEKFRIQISGLREWMAEEERANDAMANRPEVAPLLSPGKTA